MDKKAAGPLKMKARVTGEGAPLVLVPGGLTGWASWEPFVFRDRARQIEQGDPGAASQRSVRTRKT
jgi:hypothetical protein